MYDYEGDGHNQRRPSSRGSKHGMENANGYGGGTGSHHDPYGDDSSFGDAMQGDDDDDMW